MSTSHAKRSAFSGLPDLHPVLQQTIAAAAATRPPSHAAALHALARWAQVQVPAHGALEPADLAASEFYNTIEAAAAHFDLPQLRAAWRASLDGLRLPLVTRDQITSAELAMAAAVDSAYYYAGLAAGLTFAAR